MKPLGASDLACPDCKRPLKALRCPSCGRRFGKVEGFPMLLPKSLGPDMLQSIEAWNKEWATLKGAELKRRDEEYRRDYLEDTLAQLLAGITPGSHPRFLEIGCGPSFLGRALNKLGFQTAGLDCCIEALKVARKNHARNRRPTFFMGGEVNHIPLKDNSVDFLYGGGVIEHFEDTKGCLEELHRILKPGGISFNTVPYASISSLTYRQIWGNIINVPVLKQLGELLHIRLLGGGHMKYGYEMSFTASKMRRLHLDAGFRQVEIRRFDVHLPLYFLPGPLKGMARALSRWRPFWPMIAVVAKK